MNLRRILLFLYLICTTSFPQGPEWVSFNSPGIITGFTSEENYIWTCSSYGLTKLNILTNEKEYYKKENSGLPTNLVSSITIDNKGNKWIGTYGYGLIKFDGLKWTVFNNSNSGLPENFINKLAADQAGNVWIGTDNAGVVKFDGTNWTIYNTSNSSLPGNRVTKLSIDRQGTIWVSIHMQGISKFDGKDWIMINNPIGLFQNGVWDITSDKAGNIWVATIGYLAKHDGINWTQYNTSNSGLPDNNVFSVLIDMDDNVWAGTESGLAKFDGQTWIVYNTSNSGLNSNAIYFLYLDLQGNKWIGTNRGNLVKFDSVSWTPYNFSNSNLPTFAVSEMEFDNLGNLWIASFTKGLIKFDGKNCITYNSSNSGLPSDELFSLEFDQEENLWIGTQYGVVMHDGYSWILYNQNNSGLPDGIINSITIDSLENKWVAVTGKGVYRFDGQNWLSVAEIPLSIYNTLYCDSRGNIWVGGDGGDPIRKFDGQNWTTFKKTISGLSIYGGESFNEDRYGNIWCINSDYLLKFNGQDFSSISKAELEIGYDDYMIDLNIDALGNKWIVLQDGGFFKFDGETSTIFNSENSFLPTNHIYDLNIDSRGNKWIATSSGISIFREEGVILTDVKKDINYTSTDFSLLQNFPNPFNPTTTISYSIKAESHVDLKVFDILGNEVSTLVSKSQTAGHYNVKFDGSNLPSGIYIYTLTSDEFSKSKKLLLLK